MGCACLFRCAMFGKVALIKLLVMSHSSKRNQSGGGRYNR